MNAYKLPDLSKLDIDQLDRLLDDEEFMTPEQVRRVENTIRKLSEHSREKSHKEKQDERILD